MEKVSDYDVLKRHHRYVPPYRSCRSKQAW